MVIYRNQPEGRHPSVIAAAGADKAAQPAPGVIAIKDSPLPLPVAPAGAGGRGGGGSSDNRLPPDAPVGDAIIYGADAIARQIFKDYAENPKRARRRVYNLWAHHHARNEQAGLFKMNGALCLSMSQWKKFHKL